MTKRDDEIAEMLATKYGIRTGPKAKPSVVLQVVMAAAIIAGAMAISYAFASAGEPTSAWLWKTVLGL